MQTEKVIPEKNKPIDPFLEQQKKKKSLKNSIIDGSAYSVMDSFTANFITPFALAMKASNTFISVLATLPGLIAVIFQFISIDFIKKLPRKKAILTGALMQGIMWLPIAFIPFYAQDFGPVALLILITTGSVFAAAVGPIWNSMMGDLVPEDKRGKYFARRNMICGATAFVSTFIAGYTLDFLAPVIGKFETFALMFIIAFLFRMISVYYLSLQYDPPVIAADKIKMSFIDFVKNIKQSNYGRFTLYLCFMGFAVNISSPFFTVYMLNELGFTYMQFTIITLFSVIASFISMMYWGKIVDKIGNKRIILLCGLLIPFIPLI
jgi:MFS family permease